MPGDRFPERVALALRQTRRQMAAIIAEGGDRSPFVLVMVYGTIVVAFAVATTPDQPNEFVHFRDIIVFVTLCCAEIAVVLLSSVMLFAVYMFLSYLFDAPAD